VVLMHYLNLPWRLRIVTYTQGVPLVEPYPAEEVRAWAWEQGIRYTLKHVQWIDGDAQIVMALWIGFYRDDDAFAFRMRWL
jgi:hypothetical protein